MHILTPYRGWNANTKLCVGYDTQVTVKACGPLVHLTVDVYILRRWIGGDFDNDL